MFIKRLIVGSLFALTMALATANGAEAAEPIIVFTSNRDGDEEIFVAMADGTVEQLTQNQVDDKEPSWSPDGNQIVWFSQVEAGSGDFDVMMMDVDGKNPVNLTLDFGTDMATQPNFSPDGTKIAFSARGAIPDGMNNNVVIIDFARETKKGKPLLYNLTVWGVAPGINPLDVQDRFQVWSPDSTQIAWMTRREGNFDIYVTAITGEPEAKKKADRPGAVQKNLTSGKDLKKDDQHPRFSPDGTKILFESKRDEDWEIYVMDSRTGESVVPLTQNDEVDRNAEWSPDGRKIVFESKRDGNSEIYVLNADGTDQVNLTNHPASDSTPKWSPDGKQILFESQRDGNREIYVMDADGANPVNSSNHPKDDKWAEWRGLGAGRFPSRPMAVEPSGKLLTTMGRIKTALLQNYPNPFNPETWIPYTLSEDRQVTISIYNLRGQLVRTLALGSRTRGAYWDKTQAAYWDGGNDSGERVATGVYFYVLQAGDFTSTRKMMLIK
ncbi:PD40 domain-containing protein [Candidatus Poribacteria bacterium]|nr:PD40 domain-containing protein [Candidatus Poribacteria bacterium]